MKCGEFHDLLLKKSRTPEEKERCRVHLVECTGCRAAFEDGCKMTCKELIEFIMQYLDGELPAEERRIFERHLSICPECVDYLDGYKKTVTATKLLGARGDEPVPPEVPAKLVNAILSARKRMA